ncbi:hypothetical protein [Variovorax paradoxus]|uniref:hypothetical protein n=1 Tax=Variovorax paradoxus TaxID=34073 RepID=UPI003397BF08
MKKTFAALGGAVALCMGLASCGGGSGGGMASPGDGASVQSASKGDEAVAYGLQAPASQADSESILAQLVDAGRDQGRPSGLIHGASGGDSRNGAYTVYAANGTEQVLSINFDTSTYAMTDASRQVTTGTFTLDPLEADVSVFNSPRATAQVNTARFQVVDGAVLGSFPFRQGDSNPPTYSVQPFLAFRSFTDDPRQFDGIYNVVGVAVGPTKGYSSSQIQQISIEGNGARLKFCMHDLVFSSGGCAGTGVESYTISRDASDAWLATNVGFPGNKFRFRMARIGDQNTFLAANPYSTPGYPPENYQRLSIGFPDIPAAQETIKARVYASDGSYGIAVTDAPMYSTNTRRPDATSSGFAYDAKVVTGTQGVQQINGAGNARFFAIRNTKLVALVGTPANLDTRGYLQIGRIDGPVSRGPNSGTYTVFASLGSRHTLTIDLEAKSYGTADEAGVSTGGTLAEDPAEPGTYIVSNLRIDSAANTARLRVAKNTVVGAFPYPIRPLGDLFQVQPFIGSNALAAAQSAIDGTYNLFTLNSDNVSAYGRLARQVRIANSGTTLQICDEHDSSAQANYTVDNCPAELKTVFAVSPDTASGNWTAEIPGLPPSSPNFARKYNFSIMEVAGQKTYVGVQYSIWGTKMFTIGLEDSGAWPPVVARGASTRRVTFNPSNSSWNDIRLDASWLDRTATHADGTQAIEHLAVAPADINKPQGIRDIGLDPGIGPIHTAMQSKGLVVMSHGFGLGTDFGMFLIEGADQ